MISDSLAKGCEPVLKSRGLKGQSMLEAVEMPIARSLRSDAVDVGTLTLQMRRAMYALFERYYVASSFERFERDLTGKDTVFLINDERGELCGFSTLAVFEMDVDGAPLRVVFSGDTIIEPS